MAKGAARVTFDANPNLLDTLGQAPWMAGELRLIAEDIARRAKSLGPKDDDAPHYVDLIDVDVGLVKRAGGSGGGWRSVYIARVNAFKFTSHWVEFGSVHNPPFAPLRRAVESVGYLRFKDSGGGR